MDRHYRHGCVVTGRESAVIEESLVGEPTGVQIDEAVRALRVLAERAYGGDSAAQKELQPLLTKGKILVCSLG